MGTLGRVVDGFGRSLGFLLVGVVTTAVVATLAALIAGRLDSIVYDVLYLTAGPTQATRAATVARYALLVGLGVAGSALVTLVVAGRPPVRSPLGLAILAQVGLVPVTTVASVVHPLLVVATGLCALGLLALVTLRWYRRAGESPRSTALGVLAGGLLVVVPLVFLGALVPLGWNTYTVVATEMPQSVTDEREVSKLPSVEGINGDPFSNCEGNESTGRTCYRWLTGGSESRALVAFLADHGVRCPYEGDSSNSAVVASYNGSRYRLTCRSLDG